MSKNKIPFSKLQACGYCRTSKEEQSIYSMNAQEEAIKFHCSTKNIDLVKVFRESESGATEKRVVLFECIDYIHQNLTIPRCLICFSIDRFSRSMLHFLKLKEKLDRKHISLYFIRENLDTVSSSGNFLTNILSSIAQYELETIKARTKLGLQEAVRQGVSLGRPQYGENQREKRRVTNHRERIVINLISDLRTQGFSYRKISNTLQNSEIPTKNYKNWNPGTIWKILHRKEK